jgi:hypothetical protein
VKIRLNGNFATFRFTDGGLIVARVGDDKGVSCSSTSGANGLYGESSVGIRVYCKSSLLRNNRLFSNFPSSIPQSR